MQGRLVTSHTMSSLLNAIPQDQIFASTSLPHSDTRRSIALILAVEPNITICPLAVSSSDNFVIRDFRRESVHISHARFTIHRVMMRRRGVE